jgi:hypothetical protein
MFWVVGAYLNVTLPEQVTAPTWNDTDPPGVKELMHAAANVNVAVTLVAALRFTTQLPVPLHPPPLQPANVLPAAGLAVSVTFVNEG